MIPAQYKWVLDETAPKMIVESVKFIGIHEVPGAGNNPIIMEWAEKLGVKDKYEADSMAWCALDFGMVIINSGKHLPLTGWDILRALSYVKFGMQVNKEDAMFGDTMILKRPEGGHVGLYIGEDDDAYHILGGNQSDAHGFTRIAKARLFAVRRPYYNSQPPQVRKIYLSKTGAISSNEA